MDRKNSSYIPITLLFFIIGSIILLGTYLVVSTWPNSDNTTTVSLAQVYTPAPLEPALSPPISQTQSISTGLGALQETPTLINVITSPTSSPEATTITPAETSAGIAAAEATVTATVVDPALISPSSGNPQFVDEAIIDTVLAGLTLDQKIGQMLMVGIPGTTVDGIARNRVVNQEVGGIVLLEHNATSPQQTFALTQALQRAALDNGASIPLFIGWNLEGGQSQGELPELHNFQVKGHVVR